MYFYSPSKKGFYSNEVHGNRFVTSDDGETVLNEDCLIPDDAIEVSESERLHLLREVNAGRYIDVDDEGGLILIDVDFSNEELSLIVRNQRDSLISDLSWRYERNASEVRLGVETTDSIELLDQYAQALRDISEQEGFPSVIEWPEAP